MDVNMNGEQQQQQQQLQQQHQHEREQQSLQMAMMQRMMEQLAEHNQRLAAQNDILMQRLEQTAAPPPSPPPPSSGHRRPRAMLPDPEKFDGERRKWRTWATTMESKLTLDMEALGGPTGAFAYIFSRLEGNVQSMVLNWYQERTTAGLPDPQVFLTQLATLYLDRNIADKALAKLQTMKQKERESFASFFPRFERELGDAGLASGSDATKIGYLKAAVNKSIKQGMIGPGAVFDKFPQYVAALFTVSAQIESIEGPSRTFTRQAVANSGSLLADAGGEPMDWEPTVRAQKARPAAQWVERDVIDQRVRDGSCIRCGKQGHFINKCKFGPAARPQQSVPTEQPKKRTVVKKAAKQPATGIITEMVDETDSGNE